MQLRDVESLESEVRRAVEDVTVTDIHTHLFPPSHGNLLLWGVDELLTYHYLVAELFTVAPRSLRPAKFWKLSKARQADLVWEYLFLAGGALSEACRGVITTLNVLGLDVANRDLAGVRQWFGRQKIDEYLPRVFELAGLDYAVMTNDPFKPQEVKHWKADTPRPDCFRPALRIDTMILDWPAACKTISAAGYKTGPAGGAKSFAEGRKFLLDWAKRIKPLYLAASLAADFAYPSRASSSAVIKHVVVPAAMELGIPVAMMIGVRKGVNPALGDGGDGVGVADVTAVQHLCQEFPKAKFIVTMLSRVNQHELCVLARKFGHLHVEGCWWFCNVPSIIEEITRMRLELLGTAFTVQHSDARILDQVIYKWAHTRKIVADVLVDKYTDLFGASWRPTADEIRRDVRAIFGGSFEAFLAK
ncbi:MAG: glucuronate isomerase [Phycisphaerae bacterium]|nr:glucuronate isomerase [Phycisphaerae bacterium]